MAVAESAAFYSGPAGALLREFLESMQEVLSPAVTQRVKRDDTTQEVNVLSIGGIEACELGHADAPAFLLHRLDRVAGLNASFSQH